MNISAYAMSVLTNIAVAAKEGAEGQKEKENIADIGSMILESVMLMEQLDGESDVTPFKVV